MPALEDAIVTSAGGDFGLLLLFFLIAVLTGSFIWAIRKILEQSADFNNRIIDGMKEYKTETCEKLDSHDEQAKEILKTTNEIYNTLKNRPCIADRK